MRMNTNGLCPILSSAENVMSKCSTDNCAWWDNNNQNCVMFSIYESVRAITNGGIYNLNDVCSKITDLQQS